MARTLNEIKQLIDDSSALKLLASAYSDVAGSKLLRIRNTIERNRSYVTELATIFHIIRAAAEKQKVDLSSGRSGNINLIITSNHRFYGGLETRLMQFFLARSVITYGKTIVIGRSGQEFLKAVNYSQEVEAVTWDSDLPTTKQVAEITDQLTNYEKVFIFHAKLQSVLVQKPAVLEVGGLVDIPVDVDPRYQYYIFEPEIREMINFFDRQITRVLLEQTFLESELARTAARLVSMEEAQRNADGMMKRENKELMRAQSSIANSRMLEILLGSQIKRIT